MMGHRWLRRGAPLALTAALVAGLIACATPSGEPQATPSSLEFGPTAVGSSATRDVVVANAASSGALTIESIGIAGPDAAMFSDGFDDAAAPVLDPGASLTVIVEFAPAAAGLRSATLRVNHCGSAR
jgi:hypothetical protein